MTATDEEAKKRTSKEEKQEADAQMELKLREARRTIFRYMYAHPYCTWAELQAATKIECGARAALSELSHHGLLITSQTFTEAALATRKTWSAPTENLPTLPHIYRFKDNVEADEYFETAIAPLLTGIPLRPVDESKLPSYVRLRRERKRAEDAAKAQKVSEKIK